MKLSVIIPCYNEEKNLPLLINRCKEVFILKEYEVILVDNGSTDKTAAILKELLKNQSIIKSIHVEKNQGYGFGILSGLHAATGDILAWTHADMQTDPADVLKGWQIFKAQMEPYKFFIKGKRYGRPVSDILFTIGMAIFESLILKRFFWDINAQPTMLHRTLFEKWDNPPHDFSLDLYSYYQAHIHAYAIKRFPVYFGKRAHGISHWNIDFKSKIKFIKRTITFSLMLRKRLIKNTCSS